MRAIPKSAKKNLWLGRARHMFFLISGLFPAACTAVNSSVFSHLFTFVPSQKGPVRHNVNWSNFDN